MPIPTRTPARRARRLLALAVAAASVAALPATAAAAPRHVVIRAFVKTASFAYMQADGTPVAPPPARPAVGDSLETTELAYPGTHRRHARRWRWTGHTICTFIVADAACPPPPPRPTRGRDGVGVPRQESPRSSRRRQRRSWRDVR